MSSYAQRSVRNSIFNNCNHFKAVTRLWPLPVSVLFSNAVHHHQYQKDMSLLKQNLHKKIPSSLHCSQGKAYNYAIMRPKHNV